MSTSVDNRIVKMGFENTQFMNASKETMGRLSGLNKTLGNLGNTKAFKNISDGISKVDTTTLVNGVDKIKERFSALEIAGVTALVNITNSAVNAGKRVVSSLTIDPVMAGFSEYELKLRSVQTIMAGTGKDIGTVSKYLEELNTYSDRTIYSFSDMTESIGKFTNAGVSLDDAVLAIKGVSNAAALAGANSTQATSAMFNFSQAMSSGYMNLVDWRSITQTAGMGTVQFKQELIDTAVKMGNLIKVGNDYQSTTTNLQGKTSDLFNITKNFDGSLQHQWMTAEVLTETLKKYSDETTDLGKRAYAAAQDVKSLSDLMGTLQESAQSGWATTWEIIFGDLEEGKKLWTEVNNMIGPIISNAAKYRNDSLKAWKEQGGRLAIINSFKNIFLAISRIISPITNAFRTMLDPLNGSTLAMISKGFEKFTSNLIISEETSKMLGKVFEVLFTAMRALLSLIEPVMTVFNGLFSLLTPFLSIFLNLAGTLFGFTGGLTSASGVATAFSFILDKINYVADAFSAKMQTLSDATLPHIDTGFKMVNNVLGKFLEKLSSGVAFIASKLKIVYDFAEAWVKTHQPIEKAKELLRDIREVILKVSDVIQKGFNTTVDNAIKVTNNARKVCKEFFEFMKNSGVQGIDFVNAGLFGTLFIVVKKLISVVKKLSLNIGGISEGISEVLGALKGTLEEYQKDIKADTIKKIATAIGILAVSILIISTIKPERLIPAVKALGILIGGLAVLVKVLSKISLTELKSSVGLSVQMIALGIALNSMARALVKLSGMNLKQTAIALVSLGTCCAYIIAISRYLERNPINPATGVAMTSIAKYALTMAIAFKMLGNLDLMEIGKGMVALAGALAAFSVYAKYTSGIQASVGLAKSAIPLAFSLIILSGAIAIFGNMDISTLVKGCATVAALLGVFAVFGNTFKYNLGSIKDLGFGILLIANSMLVLSTALLILGNINLMTVGKGLAIIASSLFIFSKASALFPANMTAIGVGLLAIGQGMILLGIALRIIGAMSFKSITKSLITMATALALIAITATALQAGNVAIIALGGSLIVLGLGLAAIGGSLFIVSAGILALDAAILASGASIGSVILGLMGMLPMLATSLAMSIVSFITIIGYNAPAIGRAIKSLLKVMINTARAVLPDFSKLFVESFTTLLKDLRKIMPEFSAFVIDLVDNMLNILHDTIPNIVNTGLDVFEKLLESLKTKLPNIVGNMIEMLGNTLIRILEGLNNFIPELVSKVVDVITAMIIAISENTEKVVNAMWTFAVNVINGLANSVEKNLPTLIKAIVNLVKAIVTGLYNSLPTILAFGKDMIIAIWNGIKSLAVWLIDNAGNIISWIWEGIKKVPGILLDAGKWVIGKVWEGIKKVPGILLDAGKWIIDKAWEGIKKVPGILLDAGKWVVDKAWEGIKAVPDILLGAGEWISEKIWDGIDATKDWLGEKCKKINGWVKGGIEAANTKIEEAGDWIAEKLGLRISEGEKSKAYLAGAGYSMASDIIGGALNKLGIRGNTSTEYESIGQKCMNGLKIGMERYSYLLNGVNDSIKNKVLSMVNSIISRLEYLLRLMGLVNGGGSNGRGGTSNNNTVMPWSSRPENPRGPQPMPFVMSLNRASFAMENSSESVSAVSAMSTPVTTMSTVDSLSNASSILKNATFKTNSNLTRAIQNRSDNNELLKTLINSVNNLTKTQENKKDEIKRITVQSILDGKVIAESIADYSDEIHGERITLYNRGLTL